MADAFTAEDAQRCLDAARKNDGARRNSPRWTRTPDADEVASELNYFAQAARRPAPLAPHILWDKLAAAARHLERAAKALGDPHVASMIDTFWFQIGEDEEGERCPPNMARLLAKGARTAHKAIKYDRLACPEPQNASAERVRYRVHWVVRSYVTHTGGVAGKDPNSPAARFVGSVFQHLGLEAPTPSQWENALRVWRNRGGLNRVRQHSVSGG